MSSDILPRMSYLIVHNRFEHALTSAVQLHCRLKGLLQESVMGLEMVRIDLCTQNWNCKHTSEHLDFRQFDMECKD